MEFTLRFADAKKDASKILAIYAPYILNTAITFEYEVPSITLFQQKVERILEQFPWIVCEKDGEVVGYAYASRQYERAAYNWNAELSVYVAPDYQRLGIGSALYHALIGILQMQGYRNVSVRIQIPNEKSVALHRSIGFEDVGIMRSIGNKFGRWLDMLCMIKQIGDYEEFPKPPVSVSALDHQKVVAYLKKYTMQL